jgi:hypothetical protein
VVPSFVHSVGYNAHTSKQSIQAHTIFWLSSRKSR